MKVFLEILFFIFVILILPIPFKLKISLSKERIIIKLYRFTILNKAFDFNELIAKKKSSRKNKEKKQSYFQSLTLKNNLKLIYSLERNILKPHISIDGFFKYSLEDSALTAISFGVLQSFAPSIIYIFNILFKIKKINIPITPIFEDNFTLKSEINCIFTISIAKTMLIVILLFKSLINIKGDELARENI
ncbi:Protein of unknown function [Clostridium sp. DSM 8431]|uniref:DUF2953 domain-containing protein n=1 Tax=Clostridium sp. DSM 8431 TaxID=1761781 RepID=UPI0008EB9C17|nr:DUF2953 domain-containing protein [Clostridium sp. DSM 8431]SFU45214.1 Protein of unknown function [Clostridium sp. DSM 8431]